MRAICCVSIHEDSVFAPAEGSPLCYHLRVMETQRKVGIAVGTFDGVHRGHLEILTTVDRIGRVENLERVAYAFRFPPRFLIRGLSSGLLLPEEVKVSLLAQRVDRVVRAEFSRVQQIPAQQFVRDLLIGELGARAIIVGQGFRFGRDREGDVALLHRIGEKEGVRVVVVPALIVNGASVSSTRIRGLIRKGKVEQATELLGRPPLLVGQVVPGDRIGRKLGYPTANLSLDSSLLLPATGVYAVHAFFDEGESTGLLYVGRRPTLDNGEIRCEVHLFSPPAIDLYSRTLEVHLLARLRGDRPFPSLDSLRRQMNRDSEHARTVLAARDWQAEPVSSLKRVVH